MSDQQLALLLSKYEAQLDLCIALARNNLAAVAANTSDKKLGLIDEKATGFREEADSPAIPALAPFEELSNQLSADINKLNQ